MKSKWPVFVLVVILAIGVYARFTGLAWHFAPDDDIGVAKSIFEVEREGGNAIFTVSQNWTYAPFQFLITPFLVSLEQSYRSVLFWGRLPSCIFSICGLLAFMYFYRRYDRDSSGKVLLALALLACSWENIMFAKQMHNYAIGLSASIGVLILLIINLQREKYTWVSAISNGLLLGIFSSMQYSIMFLMPGFFLLVLIDVLKKCKKKVLGVIQLAVSGVIYLACIFPLWFFFIRKLLASGNTGLSDWNKGHNQEYIFVFQEGANLFEHITYVVQFFLTNTYLIFRTHLGFLWEYHPAFNSVCIILLVIFSIGLLSSLFTKGNLKRAVSVYYLIFLVVWLVLVWLGKTTYSPTRHTALFLPFFIFGIVEGVNTLILFAHKLFNNIDLGSKQRVLFACLALLISVTFLLNYRTFLSQRRDPFVEKDFIALMKKYNVDSIMTAMWTQQPEMMPEVRNHYNFFQKGFMLYNIISNGPAPYQRMAWVSHRQDLSPKTFNRGQKSLNRYIHASNFLREKRGEKRLPFLRYPLESYRVIYRDVRPSETEVEFSNIIKWRKNGYYIYILDRKS